MALGVEPLKSETQGQAKPATSLHSPISFSLALSSEYKSCKESKINKS